MRLKENKTKINKSEYSLKDWINTMIHLFNIRRQVWYSEKMTAVSCSRLMKTHNKTFSEIEDEFIEMNKGVFNDEEIEDFVR